MRTPYVRRDHRSAETQNVDVFCRIKPNFTSSEVCIEVVDEQTIKAHGSRGNSTKESVHTFASVFLPESDQEAIFQRVALPLVSELLQGKNGLLFTYGVTGSGKTYSMQGTAKEPGILPRALDVIFNSIGSNQTKKYVVKPDGLNSFDVRPESDALLDRHNLDYQQRVLFPRSDITSLAQARPRESVTVDVPAQSLFAVFVSLTEVYNNCVYDLLQESSDLPKKTLTTRVLREDAQRNVYVSGAVEVEVKSADDALRVFAIGQKRRRIGQTALNAESSRSHCVFVIRLVRTGYDNKYGEALEDKNSIVISQLCLVDLAGSERTSRSGTQGNRLKEASNINNSLMNLRKCIEALRDIQSNNNRLRGSATPGTLTRIVPYRDTRLTHLFKNFFEGDGHVVMLVCVNQAVDDYDETMHVLKFAETSQEVATYKTVLPPTPAPMSCGRLRPRATRTSAHSNATGDTSISILTMDDPSMYMLNELDSTTDQVNHCITQLLNRDSNTDSDLDLGFESELDLSDSEQPTEPNALYRTGSIHLNEHGDQDSAPEQDVKQKSSVNRSSKKSRKRFSVFSVELEPLRALLTRQMDCRKRACDALMNQFTSFRNQLMGLDMIDANNQALDLQTENLKADKLRLEARVRHLESLSKQLESRLIQQRLEAQTNKKSQKSNIPSQTPVNLNPRRRSRSVGGDASRWLGQHDATSVRLQQNHHHQETDSDVNTETKSSKNLVSVLSKQWESRLAQQKLEAQNNKRFQKVNNALAPTKTPGHRIAAFNPRHRRSRSVGGDNSRWLEHQEVTPAPLGTLFSPSLKRRKSVTQVELKDTLNAENYVLHHQEADSDGNIETRLFKGSIIPTAGGGSAVIFNDVEILRQVSPTCLNKSNSEPNNSKPVNTELNSIRFDLQSEQRRTSKRRLSSSRSPTHRISNNSNHTEGSQNSDGSSAYTPIVPPIMAIGISHSNGMGTRGAEPLTHNLRNFGSSDMLPRKPIPQPRLDEALLVHMLMNADKSVIALREPLAYAHKLTKKVVVEHGTGCAPLKFQAIQNMNTNPTK